MDLKGLNRLVSQGEGQHLEFKLKANHPEKIVREMVAFANASGGTLLIGVEDGGLIKGLKYANEEQFVLEREIDRSIYPKIDYAMEAIRLLDGKEVLVFHISKGENQPYFVINPQNELERKAYVRVADRSIQASREVKQILKGLSKGKDLRFNYGEKEDRLMKYLGQHNFITLSNFAKIADIPQKIASRTLILLVLTNVLRVQPQEHEDLFFAN
ncbi:ATP-binding protein [Marinilongibacter aquaticus]|uniref:AlbA family DNA-binding domain-containing protein n=1 Tax=Marinilongibacter aquaticus TaxID=2975157 RepID=UPI0021BCFD93|nr:ATP-binding protein [Marinilongibacter aquaticus]UBM57843.1 ATP-binding protein [Marinilongibacter aquaticus]